MTRARTAVVALLVFAAYWAALPWIDCVRSMYPFGGGAQACSVGFQLTYGFPPPLRPGGSFPDWGYWPNIAFGLAYLLAAVRVARRREPI